MLAALRISTTKRSTTSRGSYAAQGGGGGGGGSGPAPTVSSITPLAGDPAGGTAVALAGTGFVTGATVAIGGSAATSVVVVSGLSITCVTPSGTAGPKNVVVTNPDAQTGTLTNGYAYVTVTSVSPTSGVVGTTITSTGTGFAAGQAVLIGGTAADNVVYTSSTSIDADVPSGVSGLVDVSVAGVTLADAFTAPIFTDDWERASPITKTMGGVSTTGSGAPNDQLTISTEVARSGTRSLKWLQGWQQGITDVQLNFSGLATLSEVWAEFYLWLPDGSTPAGVQAWTKGAGGGTSNDKFFRLWGTSYTGEGSKVGASIWANATPNGWGRIAVDWAETGWAGAVGPDHANYNPTTGPYYAFPVLANLGQWLRIRIHCKVATSANNDGVVQIWVDDTAISNLTNLMNYPSGGVNNHYTAGYLLGSGNNFAAGQVVYMDDFSIYDTNPGW